MIKYTRTQINKNALIHDKEFVTVEDASAALTDVFEKAEEAGADMEKLMGLLNEEQ